MIKINSSDRLLIAGQTGTGKSFFTKYLTRDYPNLIVYDYKHEVVLENAKIIYDIEALANAKSGRFIFRPTPEFLNDKVRRENLELLFKVILHRKNTILWIDEIYSVCENALSFPSNLRSILTMGRSLNIGVIGLTQRPAFIPRFFISESQHVITFRLILPDDEDRIEKFIGNYDHLKPIKQYEFIYFNLLKSQNPQKYILKKYGNSYLAKEV